MDRPGSASGASDATRILIAENDPSLDAELERLRRTPLVIIDEVGYIPFDPDAAAAVLRAHLQPLRTRLAHRQQQQDLLRLGRDLRRRPSPSPPWSTGSSTTPKSTYSKATATACAPPAKTSWAPLSDPPPAHFSAPDTCSRFGPR